MLKLAGLKPENEIRVRLVTVFEKESINDIAQIIQKGLWRFPGSKNRKNTLKFGTSEDKCIILENDFTIYQLSELQDGNVQVTKIFRTKMKNEKLRNNITVEEFLAMKNFI